MTCPKCKSQLPAGAIACTKCGTRFKTKTCPHCNSAILATSSTCPRCGKRLTQAAATASATAYTPANSSKGGFRWWYILIGVGIFILGAGVGAAGMRQYIISNVKSAFNQVSDSLKDFTNSSQSSSSAASEEDSSPETSEKAPEEENVAGKYYFANDVLVAEDVKIEITDWKVIPVGEAGNEYGNAPVIAFWYSTTSLSDNENITPMSAWIAMFTAIQDNNSDMVNELNVASLPDSAFVDTQLSKIKKGGTVDCACAYTLSDTTTPVILKATRGILGEDLGEQTYHISE